MYCIIRSYRVNSCPPVNKQHTNLCPSPLSHLHLSCDQLQRHSINLLSSFIKAALLRLEHLKSIHEICHAQTCSAWKKFQFRPSSFSKLHQLVDGFAAWKRGCLEAAEEIRMRRYWFITRARQWVAITYGITTRWRCTKSTQTALKLLIGYATSKISVLAQVSGISRCGRLEIDAFKLEDRIEEKKSARRLIWRIHPQSDLKCTAACIELLEMQVQLLWYIIFRCRSKQSWQIGMNISFSHSQYKCS